MKKIKNIFLVFRLKLFDNRGIVFVEASIVFPIMFFVLFFLIFFGNAYYEKAKIDDYVVEYAIKGANHCADPMLKVILETGEVPSSADIKPYRYIFGGMNSIEAEIESEIIQKISGGGALFFKDMKPELSTGNIAKFNNYVLYSTFSVDIKYSLKFPIRFLGSDRPTILKINSRAEAPVSDTAEFIRNTDMAINFLEGTKFGKTIADGFKKVNDFLNQFAAK